jgi:hypothetical protein
MTAGIDISLAQSETQDFFAYDSWEIARMSWSEGQVSSSDGNRATISLK